MFHTFVVILALLATIFAKPAFAAETSRNGLKFGTREQFRACMDEEDTLKARRQMLDQHLAENNAAMKQIQEEATAIVKLQRFLDLNNEDSVAAFNKRVEAHNKLVKRANERAVKFKDEEEKINEDTTDHNKKCAVLVFKVKDREAVLRERKTAENQIGAPEVEWRLRSR